MAKAKETPAEKSAANVPAVRGNTAVAAFLAEDTDAVSKGSEFAVEDLAIPFIGIVQKNSPEVEEGHQKYIEGARPGMIFNNLTKELFSGSEGFLVSPAGWRTEFLEWVPRNDGGGLVGVYDVPTGKQMLTTCKKGGESGKKDILPNGHELVKTNTYTVNYVRGNGEIDAAAISMKSTMLKKSKAWNSLIDKLKLPTGALAAMFAGVYRMTVVREEGNGQSWYNWQVTAEGFHTDPEFYNATKQLYNAFKAGQVKIDHATEGNNEGGDGGFTDNDRSVDAEVPF